MRVREARPLRRVLHADAHRLRAARGVGTAGGRVQQVRRLPLDGDQTLLRQLVRVGDRPQEPAGVGMRRGVKDVAPGSPFYDAPAVHDEHPVGHARDHPQVVGDQDDRRAELPLKLLHQVQDLGLDGDVQGRRRFVGDQQVGMAHQRHGDHDALPLPAAELVRVLADTVLRGLDAHAAQHLERALPPLGGRAASVAPKRFLELIADGEHGVQARHGVLKDHGDAPSPQVGHPPFGDLRQLGPVEDDAPAHDAPGSPEQAQQRQHGHALAAPGLADDPQHLAPPQLEGHPADRLHLPNRGEEGGTQVLHPQKGVLVRRHVFLRRPHIHRHIVRRHGVRPLSPQGRSATSSGAGPARRAGRRPGN